MLKKTRVGKEITPVNPEEITHNVPERTDDEAEVPILWQPDAKSQLITKVVCKIFTYKECMYKKDFLHTKKSFPRCWERLKAGGEGDDSGQDGWMTSPTQGTLV